MCRHTATGFVRLMPPSAFTDPTAQCLLRLLASLTASRAYFHHRSFPFTLLALAREFLCLPFSSCLQLYCTLFNFLPYLPYCSASTMFTGVPSEASPAAVAIAESLGKVSQVITATIFLASESHFLDGQPLTTTRNSVASLCVMVYDASKFCHNTYSL